MKELLAALKVRYPELHFRAGETFCWSPETHEVIFARKARAGERGERDIWSLLHETGHALLGHTAYTRDLELLQMEMAAWSKARELAANFEVIIDENHIQDCLDTYRDWLHARSTCPNCTTKAFQQRDPGQYRCHNCNTSWHVTPARFARAYRGVKATEQVAVVI